MVVWDLYDSYRLLCKQSLDGLVETLNEGDFSVLKKKNVPNNWYLIILKKLAYPYEYFKKIEEYSKDISNLSTKQEYFSYKFFKNIS